MVINHAKSIHKIDLRMTVESHLSNENVNYGPRLRDLISQNQIKIIRYNSVKLS